MIKPVFLEDIDEVVLLSCDYIDAYKKETLLSGYKNGLKIDGYYLDRLVGYIAYTKSVDFWDIDLLFVSIESRNCGIGKELVTSVIKKAKEEKIKKIFLEVRKSNNIAIKLYSGLGFNKISERKKYYKNTEDALVLVKEIDL